MPMTAEKQSKLLKIVTGLFNGAPEQVSAEDLATRIDSGITVEDLPLFFADTTGIGSGRISGSNGAPGATASTGTAASGAPDGSGAYDGDTPDSSSGQVSDLDTPEDRISNDDSADLSLGDAINAVRIRLGNGEIDESQAVDEIGALVLRDRYGEGVSDDVIEAEIAELRDAARPADTLPQGDSTGSPVSATGSGGADEDDAEFEFVFTPTITLDNGITIGPRVHLSSDSDGMQTFPVSDAPIAGLPDVSLTGHELLDPEFETTGIGSDRFFGTNGTAFLDAEDSGGLMADRVVDSDPGINPAFFDGDAIL